MRERLEQLARQMGGRGNHEAEQLLAHALGVSRGQLYIELPEPSPGQWDVALALARRRAAGEPLQYLIGWVPFLGARIEVGPGVLVPRPETELLARTALDLWHALRSPTARVAIDVGTGSGCIAIGLALAETSLRVLGLDVSDAALEWAGRNVLANGAGGSVELYRSDVFSALPELRFPPHGASLIVSNPPYVAEGEAASLPRDVADHEPGVALFSGASGLEHLRRIAAEAHEWLASPGLLALEIGETQHDNALGLLRDAGAYSRMEVRPDLAGRPRMVFAWRGGAPNN